MWWSTGLATTYDTPMERMGIKHGFSADGVNFTITKEPVLETGTDIAAWDHSKAETPTVVRLPPGIATPQRQFLMLYSGGNDKSVRPPGINYTWYQLGAAFSSDGKAFQKLPANESPYANASTPFGNGSLEGLVLLGRDVFPGGVSGIVGGLAADPELVIDPDGTTIHVFFSSGGVNQNGEFLEYGISHATSIDGVHWLPSARNPILPGPRGPSVIKTTAGWQLFFLQDSSTELANIPTTFNPEVGAWVANSSSLFGPWFQSRSGSGVGGREVSWNGSVASEALGWIATGDMAQNAPNGEKRWYYVGFDVTPPIPNGWVAPVHPTKAYPYGLEPAVISLSMMYRK